MGVGATELIVLLAILLLIIGPKQIPKLSSAISDAMENYKRAKTKTPKGDALIEEDSKGDAQKEKS